MLMRPSIKESEMEKFKTHYTSQKILSAVPNDERITIALGRMHMIPYWK